MKILRQKEFGLIGKKLNQLGRNWSAKRIKKFRNDKTGRSILGYGEKTKASPLIIELPSQNGYFGRVPVEIGTGTITRKKIVRFEPPFYDYERKAATEGAIELANQVFPKNSDKFRPIKNFRTPNPYEKVGFNNTGFRILSPEYLDYYRRIRIK